MTNYSTLKRKVYEKEVIDSVVNKMKINMIENYSMENTLILGIMDGCWRFLGDLLFNFKVKPSVELINSKTYNGTKKVKKGTTDICKNIYHISNNVLPTKDVKDIIIVDDIIDSGNNIGKILQSLIDNNIDEKVNINLFCLIERVKIKNNNYVNLKNKIIKNKIIGFELDDKDFVVGYGMDYNGAYRSLNDIYAI